MRRNAAFQFIPELVGDFAHVMELSKNPNLLYVEAAMDTLHAAANVFSAVEEHNNTKTKKKTKQALKEKYDEMESIRVANYEEEAIRKLDITYEKVKAKVRDGQFQDKAVLGFIQKLKANLSRTICIFEKMQIDPDFQERERIEEITRRTLRDYKNILTLVVEEENQDGQDQTE